MVGYEGCLYSRCSTVASGYCNSMSLTRELNAQTELEYSIVIVIEYIPIQETA